MSLLIPVMLFLLGAVAASFVGVVAARLNTGASALAGRSRCDACNEELSPFSLVPIVSYCASGGRAQCCSSLLSPSGPASEFLLGGLFVLSYLKIGFAPGLPFVLLSIALLLALVLYDLSHQILPPPLLLAFVLASAAAGAFLMPSLAEFLPALVAALLIMASLALAHVLSRGRAMGLADAPLAFGLALLTGSAALPGFIFSFWIGALIGIIVLARRPEGSRMGVEVPFAPFLAAGFLIAYFTQWNPFALTLLIPYA
ncbi:MAG: prepilin peptidase [Patescibacteria group bacterium]|nr:prepilin peptidase [Patescibacteria group bacterium]